MTLSGAFLVLSGCNLIKYFYKAVLSGSITIESFHKMTLSGAVLVLSVSNPMKYFYQMVLSGTTAVADLQFRILVIANLHKYRGIISGLTH